MQVRTVWNQLQEFTSYQNNNFVRMDGSQKNGVSPKALLLSGLTACAGIDVVEILTKMRVPFSDFKIDAETEQTTESPKVFQEIQLVFKIKTAIENEEKVRKAINLSLEKYCGVAAMLRKNSPIVYTLILE